MTAAGRNRSKTSNTKGGIRRGGTFVRRLSRFLAVLAGALWGLVFYYSPALAVGKVEVSGARALNTSSIKTSLALEGKGLLDLDVGHIERELIKEPRVKSVEVRRWLPGTVYIDIKEREEAVLWVAENEVFVVDPEGVVLDRSSVISDLPIIIDKSGSVPVAGDTVESEMVLLARRLTDIFPEKFGAGIRELEYREDVGLSVLTLKGWRVAFGRSDNLAFKLESLEAMGPEIARACPAGSYVDLRFGYNPFFKCV